MTWKQTCFNPYKVYFYVSALFSLSSTLIDCFQWLHPSISLSKCLISGLWRLLPAIEHLLRSLVPVALVAVSPFPSIGSIPR